MGEEIDIEDLEAYPGDELEGQEFPLVQGVPVQKSPKEKAAYRPEYAAQAEKLCLLLGATNDDLALFFSVSVDTIARWRKKFPEFRDALKRGKWVADMHVADSLYRQAVGGYRIQRAKVVADIKTREKMVIRYTEELPPSPAAAIFWLKNRQPAQWRDRQQTDLPNLEQMTDEELAAIAAGKNPNK